MLVWMNGTEVHLASQGKKMSVVRILSSILLALFVSGCAGYSQIKAPVHDFAAATATVADTEQKLLSGLQQMDKAVDANEKKLAYVREDKGPVVIEFSGQASLTDDEIKVRKALLDSVKLYAQKLEALTGDDADKQLDANSKNLASSLSGLGKQFFAGTLPDQIAAAVATAGEAIGKFALDQLRYDEIKKAAGEMQPHLQIVVDTLKSENNAVGAKYEADKVQIKSSLVSTLQLVRDDSRVSKLDRARYFDHAAKEYAGLAGPEGVAAVNASLDAVANANKAIATVGQGGVIVAVRDLVARAQAAADFYKGLGK